MANRMARTMLVFPLPEGAESKIVPLDCNSSVLSDQQQKCFMCSFMVWKPSRTGSANSILYQSKGHSSS